MTANTPPVLISNPKLNAKLSPSQKWIAVILGFSLMYWCYFAIPRIALSFDEGIFNYKGWLFVKGIFTPYKDVRAAYPPFAYYPLGFFQWLFGPTMVIGRIFAAACFLIGTLFTALTARRLGGTNAMLFCTTLLLAHTFSSGHYLTATPVSWTMMFCAASFYLLTGSKEKLWQSLLSAVLASVCALTYPVMALFFLAVLFYIFVDRGKKAALFSLGASGLMVIVVLLPFVSYSDNVFLVYAPWLYYKDIETAYPYFATWLIKAEISHQIKFIATYLPFIALVTVGLFLIREKIFISDLKKPSNRLAIGAVFTFFILAALTAWSAGLTSRYFHNQTALLYFPLISAPTSVIASRAFAKKRAPIIILLVLSLLISLMMSSQLWLRLRGGNVNDLERVRIAGKKIAELTSPSDKVFAYGAPYFLLEAQRYGFAPLIDRERSLCLDPEDDLAKKRLFFTFTDLEDQLVNQADAAVTDYLGHMRIINPKVFYLKHRIQKRISEYFNFTSSLNPGDIAKNGGRPVKIWTRKNKTAPKAQVTKTPSENGGP